MERGGYRYMNAAMITALAALISSLTGLYVVLHRTDKIDKSTKRIEHMVNSDRDKMLTRVDRLERTLAIRTKQRDEAEDKLPGSRILRPEEDPHA